MRSRLVAPVVALTLLLAACAGGEPSTEEPEDLGPTPTPSSAPEPSVAPLTGEPIDAPADWPALSAKIDNQGDALPQSGLEQADIVFEELVEGGLTRYVAIWHSEIPEVVGPIRSIRPMDPAIVAPFGGAVAYSGGQDRFVNAMQATDVVNVVHGGEHDALFHRDPDRPSPHDVLLDAADLVDDELDGLEAPAPWLDFSETPSAQTAGEAASIASLTFSPAQAPSWTCDEGTERWLRAQQGGPDVDADGTQLSAANVLVLRVDVIDDQDVPSTQLAGASGTGVVLSGCSALDVVWSKDDVDAPIEIETLDGDPVTFSVGETWVELVPVGGAVDIA